MHQPTELLSDVLVTADDLGHSQERNKAILHSLRFGHVTHASLIVNLSGFEEACELVHLAGFKDRIGVHLNFTDGLPVTDRIRRCLRFCRDGYFRFPIQGRGFLPLSVGERRAVREEAHAQIARARAGGFPISHVDSHHHFHMEPNVSGIILSVASAVGIRRVRRFKNCGPSEGLVRRTKAAWYSTRLKRMGFLSARYFGDLDDMLWMFANAKPPRLPVEIMTHPSLNAQGSVIDGAGQEPLDVRLLKLRPYLPSQIDATGRVAGAIGR